jgi:1,4-dihydroxy-6-naphthoate synthase
VAFLLPSFLWPSKEKKVLRTATVHDQGTGTYRKLPTMNKIIKLGISPCPNDTYIFDAWVNGRLGPDAPAVDCRLEDVSTLNKLAFSGALDVVKVSFYAYGRLRDSCELINAGGALGRGCGPIIVARHPGLEPEQLASMRIAVPGRWTTANLLFSLYVPAAQNKVYMNFDEIMPAIARGDIDAGVIIHEGRFTYRRYGLSMVEDLGAWWERTTGNPVPLGAIIAKKELGPETIARVESAIRTSIHHARTNPEAPRAFMKQHAAEMDDAVMDSHIALYVNNFSFDYGEEGRAAIRHLLACGEEKELFK